LEAKGVGWFEREVRFVYLTSGEGISSHILYVNPDHTLHVSDSGELSPARKATNTKSVYPQASEILYLNSSLWRLLIDFLLFLGCEEKRKQEVCLLVTAFPQQRAHQSATEKKTCHEVNPGLRTKFYTKMSEMGSFLVGSHAGYMHSYQRVPQTSWSLNPLFRSQQKLLSDSQTRQPKHNNRFQLLKRGDILDRRVY
jgi:hypothetical protein